MSDCGDGRQLSRRVNRIDRVFAELRQRGEVALVPFLTLGDPDVSTTLELMRRVAEAGADLIELGVPFSDPTADGPVLQHSLEVGLRAGATLPRALETVQEFRRLSETPVVLYGYYNPIFRYGVEAFARDAARAGVDGLLVVDLPPDEAQELLRWSRPAGLHFVCLLAPTSGPDRVRVVLQHAAGFIYYVSVTGVTGVKPIQPWEVRPAIMSLREQTCLPIGVGFGISTTEQAAAVAEFADAVVVGSAIMRLVDQHRGTAGLGGEVAEFVRRLKRAILEVRQAKAV
ncbi:MAG: tryptophan synthase alpha chain [Candidatus Binatia bacterium]|nr:MAG: tryptophan synthase alpha chain [Candidatus Binatia bacterium]